MPSYRLPTPEERLAFEAQENNLNFIPKQQSQYRLPTEEERSAFEGPQMQISGSMPAFLAGFIQSLGESGRGMNEMEVPVPEAFKHPKIRDFERPEFSLQQYINPENEAAFKVGELATLIATGAQGIKGIGKYLGKYTNKAIGKNIIKDVKNLKTDFNKEYSDLLNNSGIKNVKSSVTSTDLSYILEHTMNKKAFKGIEDFIHDRSAKNAHFAQSDLGKFIRNMESKKELNSAQFNALKKAREMQETIKSDLYRAMLKQGGLELPFRYSDLTNRFKQMLIPYLENAAIRKATLKPGQKGYINPERLPHKLSLESSDPFLAHIRGDPLTQKIINNYLHGKYPELGINRVIAGPLGKYFLAPSGALATGIGAYNLLKK